jgi:hypothetical protein
MPTRKPLQADARPATFAAYFDAIRENAKELRGCLLSQIRDYADSDQDTDWLSTCTKALVVVERQVTALSPIEDALTSISERVAGFEPGSTTRTETGLRSITLEVTEGMINQNIISLTAARKLGVVYLGERMKIELPDGTEFETEVIEPGNRLRERGLIRAFFQKENIAPAEKILLAEQSHGNWRLSKVEEKTNGLALLEPTSTGETSSAITSLLSIRSHEKSKKTGLRVVFSNGKVIQKRFAADTFAAALQEIGLQKVETLSLTVRGLPLVGAHPSRTYQQRKIGDRYLVVHSSTPEKKAMLEQIAHELGIDLAAETVN